MSDAGHKYTDEQIKELEKQIHSVYAEAREDLTNKLDDFKQKHAVKNALYLNKLQTGEITQEQYDAWYAGQMFQRKQWSAKKEQIILTMLDANKVALSMINQKSIGVFAENATFMNYMLEHGTGVNFGFGVYDETTVSKLIMDNPQMLPKWKIDEKKDYIWNEKKVNNAVTQGIIQGEGIDKITKRIASGLCSQNENLMKTFSRTAMTGAQNAGRLESLSFANEIGIDVYKQWMATLDSHTRDSHADVDGETVPVNSKFSNGLEYPGEPGGAPAEVYNCRCTMVGDVKNYPAKYKRYNNEKGKPIQYMTYDKWAKSKSAGAKGFVASQGGKGKPIDYSKYGGKDVYDILSKYNDFEDFVWNSSMGEFDVINKFFNGNSDEIKKTMSSIQQDQLAKETKKAATKQKKQEQEQEKQKQAEENLKKAQGELDKLNKEIKDKGADKTFEDIWKDQTVTYADYEVKKDSIQGKIDYYTQKMAEYDASGNFAAYAKMEDKLNELKEFDKNGAAYSELLKKRDELQKQVYDMTPKQAGFTADSYSRERKDAALWTSDKREADRVLRSSTGEVWRNATTDERAAVYEYTVSYHKFNEPLRGIEYGSNVYKGVGNTDLNASYANNGKMLNDMTSIIDKSTYSQDVWLQRGCDYRGMDKFFGCSEDLLRYGTQEELKKEFLGKTITEYGFMSCGTAKGQGFQKSIIMNVYAPSGTKMLYAEPFSGFGNGAGLSWDGISEQSSFGGEFETILQQGTQFRIIKVERSRSTVYVDLEVIAQNSPQLWKK